MKSRILTWITGMTLFTSLAMPVRIVAQEDQPQQPERLQHYTVTDLGTLGGTSSMAFFTNNKGSVGGTSSLPDGTGHAFLWQKGLITDLGTLGGPNSIAFGSPTQKGQTTGQAETSSSDPNGEDYCGFGTHLICLAFLGREGAIVPLPTLGGNNGQANWINDRGEVAGSAEKAVPDPACPAPQVLQFAPVIWENGEIQELPTFPGDPDGVAFGINDHGQVVGASGECATFNPNIFANLLPLHALLWQKGTVTDLGNLGGTFGNVASAANNQGQVVGVSDLPGDKTFHGFLWTKHTGIRDLGTLSGDVSSVALGINDGGEVVGVSIDASFNLRAFLRRNGVMIDLTTLIPADSPLLPFLAESINSRGQIAGTAIQKSTGEIRAFLATPRRCEDGSGSGASAEPCESSESEKVALSENVREVLQQRLGFGRFGARLMGPR